MMKSPRHCYEFGPFRLDPSERQLLRAGQVMPLTPKVFDTLLLFVESNNLLLTKDEMIGRLWPDSFVEESNLAQNVSMLRRALGEQPNGKPYIETVPKRGYRFTAEVRLRSEEQPAVARGESALTSFGPELAGAYERRANEAPELTPAPISQPLEPQESRPPASNGAKPSITPLVAPAWRHRRVAVWAAIALIIVAAGGAYLLSTPKSPSRSEVKARLAVLPFRNLGPDKRDDFLSLSLADEVIAKLNYISALTVRPSIYVRKYAGQEIDPAQVANELKVDILLTGAYLREGDELRINLQLIDVAANQTLWGESLQLKYEKLMTVQDRVAQSVVRRISVSLTPAESARLQRGAASNLQAYEYHLNGVDIYHRSDLRDDLKKAGDMFEKSVGLDPTYAPSWAYLGAIDTTLASIYFEGRESYDKARQAYDRALELDPSQIEARIFKANLLTDTGSVEEAVPLLRGVIGTNPNLAQAHWNLAYAYRFGGLLRESISEGERSRQINGEIKADNSVFNGYFYDGQYEKFIQSLPAREDSAYVTFYRGLGHYYLKRWKEASAYFDRAYQLEPKLMPAQIGKALSHGLAGQTASGRKLLKEAEEKIIKSGVADAEGVYKIAQAFAALNDRPPALRLLRRSIEGGFFCYPYFTNDPLLDNLRGEAEFAELMGIARRRHEEFKRQFSAP
jgi:DNA-binding winged helix-turn-helix (wHTH) protein/TolB-like protein/Tfp pilus assembly protein PilF